MKYIRETVVYLFGSRQLVVDEMNGRAGAQKNRKIKRNGTVVMRREVPLQQPNTVYLYTSDARTLMQKGPHGTQEGTCTIVSSVYSYIINIHLK